MRCPHCGYNSFARTVCKRCGGAMNGGAEPLQPPLPLDDDNRASAESPCPSVVEREFPQFIGQDKAAAPRRFLTGSLLLRRFFALVCDVVLIAAVVLAFVAVALWQLDADVACLVQPRLWQPQWLGAVYLLATTISLSYFAGFYATCAQTPGQQLLGLRLQCCDGTAPGWRAALLRCAGGTLALLCGGYGYAVMLFDAEQRGWNDRFAATRVVANGGEDGICQDARRW